jgi:hypothetical protein
VIQVDVPIACGVGAIFADAAHRQIQTGLREHYYRAFLWHNAYLMLVYCWVPVYFLLNYFGWETSHMWWHADTVLAYPFFVPTLLVAIFLGGNAAFVLGARLIRSGRAMTNRAIYLALSAYSAAFPVLAHEYTFRLGTYAEWKAGTAPYFYEDGTFLVAFIAAMLFWPGALVVFVLQVLREGRRLGNTTT